VAPLSVSVTDAVSIAETCTATMALPGVAVGDVVSVVDVIAVFLAGVAHADWTLSDAAANRWTVGAAAVNHWTVSDGVVNRWTVAAGAVWGWTVQDSAVNQWSVEDRSRT